MNKKILTGGVIVLIALAAVILFLVNRPSTALSVKNEQQIIFFYGRECPHCKKVEQFIIDHHLHKKIKFAQKEVYHNRSNLMQLVKLAQRCGKDTRYIEVPFLWTGHTCLVGNNQVIKFLKEQEHEKNVIQHNSQHS